MRAGRPATLAALGFSTDASAGNFVRERPVPDDEALYDVAGMLVETPVRVYDLKTFDVVLHQAPLAPTLPRTLPSAAGAARPRSARRPRQPGAAGYRSPRLACSALSGAASILMAATFAVPLLFR
jgi:hypothetical protein